MRVREAGASDTSIIVDQVKRIIKIDDATEDSLFDWSGEHLPSLALVVMDDADTVIGHATVGASKARITNRFNLKSAQGKPIMWWKIHTLAVEDDYRKQGAGRALLDEIIDRAPREVPGIYGSITLSKTPSAPSWYRKQGFRVTTEALTKDIAGPGTGLIPLIGEPDNAYFYAPKDQLRHFSKHPYTEEHDCKLAMKEADFWFSKSVDRITPDYSFRAFGALLISGATSTCEHIRDFGPQTQYLYGWDPKEHIVCQGCNITYLATIPDFGQNMCDGCGTMGEDVEIKSTRVDLTLVAAGLCGECRGSETFPRFTSV